MQVPDLFVTENMTIKQALATMSATSYGLLLLVDSKNEAFARTITDGDLRRALLAEENLEQTLAILAPIKPIFLEHYPNAQDAIALMDEHDIDHIPIVDQQHRPVSIVRRKDITAKVLLSVPHLGEKESQFVAEAFSTNWVAPLGPNVDAFEQELADYVGVKAAAALSSGTAALHLALRVLGVTVGDNVFCSSLTFVASANPILYEHATPVFIDSERESWNMCPKALARAFEAANKKNKLPKAVIVVNLYGQSAKMDEIVALCDQYNVPIIEDAAESLGATYRGKASGTFGRLGVFSFNGNKIITTSGGGMLVSDDVALIEKARSLSTQAKENMPYYHHTEIGYNYRMSNVLAGIGRGQIRVLDERVAERRAVFSRYVAGLAEYKSFDWIPELTDGNSTRWLTAASMNPEKTDMKPQQLADALQGFAVEARRVWKPMHLQPLFEGCQYYTANDGIDVSGELFEQGICLPSSSSMSATEQAHVINAIKQICHQYENTTVT